MHSSQVRGWLMVAGVPHELAQVGPCFCIIRDPTTVGLYDEKEQAAELIIEVDGEQRCVEVVLCGRQHSRPKYLCFRKVSFG